MESLDEKPKLENRRSSSSSNSDTDSSSGSNDSSSSNESLFSRAMHFLRIFFTSITVEPVVFMICVGTGLYMIVQAEIYIEKVL